MFLNGLQEIKRFYNGKRVFLTGHTGFKGSWLCVILKMLGAEVYGYSLKSNTDPDLFDILGISNDIHHTIGDIRDLDALEKAYTAANPDVVLHLAAQPIVRDASKYSQQIPSKSEGFYDNLKWCHKELCLWILCLIEVSRAYWHRRLIDTDMTDKDIMLYNGCYSYIYQIYASESSKLIQLMPELEKSQMVSVIRDYKWVIPEK